MAKRIILFTGNGKGKTTSAMGMALRAWGQGMKVAVVQFVKDFKDTGEYKAISRMEGIDIIQCGLGFPPSDRDSLEFGRHRDKCLEAIHHVSGMMKSQDYGFFVLDEICFAVSIALLDESHVIETIESSPDDLIIVLTGRGATKGLMDLADTVTELTSIKHGYEKGIAAQVGVEY